MNVDRIELLVEEKIIEATLQRDEQWKKAINHLRRFPTFYDAATDQGPWGWLCKRCFRNHGKGLGIGFGQEYDSDTNVQLAGGRNTS